MQANDRHPPQLADVAGADDAQRLSKVVASLVPCSRREAEQYIAEGWVSVDGQCVDEPQRRVTTGQRVKVDPQARLTPVVSATFLVHKPAEVEAGAIGKLLTAANHWSGDLSGIRRSKAHQSGLHTLLPLPTYASGLCVVSQDFRVVRKLTEDAELIEQELIAEVKGTHAGTIAPGGLALLELLGHGLVRNGQPLPPAHVSWQNETHLRFAIKGIPPDWISWMCAEVGLELIALRRIRIGRVPMSSLPPQQWRFLPADKRF